VSQIHFIFDSNLKLHLVGFWDILVYRQTHSHGHRNTSHLPRWGRRNKY